MPLRPLLSRWIWRQLRRLQHVRDKPPTIVGIESYTVFGGRLHIAGTVATHAPVQHLGLYLPGGERLPLEFDASVQGRVRFDQTLEVPAPAAELAQAVLVLSFADGQVVRHSGLGEAGDDPAHRLAADFRAHLAERPPGRLLEIGSRARSGIVRRDWAPESWAYSGFDIVAGPNVEEVGDAHALSRHYPAESFDAVMAFSVLEHLLMPWKFVVELNRVLKPGAVGIFTTHQTWPLHDQPWDFWRFSDTAWTGLLNVATGFEIIDARMGEPAFIVPRRCSVATAFPERPSAALASFVLFRKIGPTTLQWPVELADIVQTRYPAGETTN